MKSPSAASFTVGLPMKPAWMKASGGQFGGVVWVGFETAVGQVVRIEGLLAALVLFGLQMVLRLLDLVLAGGGVRGLVDGGEFGEQRVALLLVGRHRLRVAVADHLGQAPGDQLRFDVGEVLHDERVERGDLRAQPIELHLLRGDVLTGVQFLLGRVQQLLQRLQLRRHPGLAAQRRRRRGIINGHRDRERQTQQGQQ